MISLTQFNVLRPVSVTDHWVRTEKLLTVSGLWWSDDVTDEVTNTTSDPVGEEHLMIFTLMVFTQFAAGSYLIMLSVTEIMSCSYYMTPAGGAVSFLQLITHTNLMKARDVIIHHLTFMNTITRVCCHGAADCWLFPEQHIKLCSYTQRPEPAVSSTVGHRECFSVWEPGSVMKKKHSSNSH